MDRLRRLAVVSALVLAGCGGGGSGGEAAPLDPAAFVAQVNHPYFPVVAGETWIYDGTYEGLDRREYVSTLPDHEVVAGVRCVARVEHVYDDGILVEVTTEWFAQDARGNVWKLGEESSRLEDGVFVPSEDSWKAGAGEGRAWIAFPVNPRPGSWFSGYNPDGNDMFFVVGVSETVVVPAGTFFGCMRIRENPNDPEDVDVILYAPGVGRLVESSASGRVELTERQPSGTGTTSP